MMDENTIKLQACCTDLRHKMMYCDPRHAARGQVDDSSEMRVFFCVKTGDPLGPDGEATCPDDCQSGRSCYRNGDAIA
jgi:hypothetical protein